MTVETGHTARVRQSIAAPLNVVFEAWTRPEQLKEWSCPEGATIDDVRVDLRMGGSYRIRMRGAEGETYTAFGEYREIDAPHRLVYTWDWEEDQHQVGETLVSVLFEATTSGGTDVTIVHSGFPAPEAAEGHDTGWSSCLSRLKGLLGGEG